MGFATGFFLPDPWALVGVVVGLKMWRAARAADPQNDVEPAGGSGFLRVVALVVLGSLIVILAAGVLLAVAAALGMLLRAAGAGLGAVVVIAVAALLLRKAAARDEDEDGDGPVD